MITTRLNPATWPHKPTKSVTFGLQKTAVSKAKTTEADERRAIKEFADAILRNRPIRMFAAVQELVSKIKTPLRETDSQFRFRQARLAITTLKVQAEMEKASGNRQKATALDDLTFLCQAVYDVEEANGGTGNITDTNIPYEVGSKLDYAISWCITLPYRDEAIVATVKEVAKLYYGDSPRTIEQRIKNSKKERREYPNRFRSHDEREVGLLAYINAGQA